MLTMLFTIFLGCNDSFDTRTLPTPSFQAGKMFVKMVMPRTANSLSKSYPFAELNVGKKVEVTTNQSQLVSLGGFITSEIPVDDMGNAWIVSSQNDEFLITYIDPESEKAPLVIIYGLYDSGAMANPTFAVRIY